MKLIASLAVLLVGCTDFESVTRGVCGNGLIEPGEDCDSGDPSCVSCAVVCTTDDECPTADYRCGIDGLCYAPGGALAEPRIVGAFETSDYQITDVDHDGVADVLGVSRSSMVVRYGDVAAPLLTVESLLTPTQSGPATFGDIDLDGSLDVSIVTPDGLAIYTTTYGRLSNREVATEIIDASTMMPADLRYLTALSSTMLFGFGGYNGGLLVLAFDLSGPQFQGPPCGITGNVDDLVPENIQIYKVRDGGFVLGQPSDVVVAMTLVSSTQRRACVLSFHKDGPASPMEVRDITPPAGVIVTSRVVLADLTQDAEPCPALVVGDPAQLRKFEGQTDAITSHCKLAGRTDLPANPDVSSKSPLLGRAPLTPIVVQDLTMGVFGLAPDMLVFGDGVWTLAANVAWGQIYKPSGTITRADFGDVDRDGDIDAVLATTSDDIDILLRVTADNAAFNLYRIDTASQPTTMIVDDFDGNLAADVAYVEPLGTGQRLMVSYGTPDRPLEPVEVGRFEAIGAMGSLRFPDASDPAATIADLVIVVASSPRRIALLAGSAQRTMTSYFDPRHEDAEREGLREGTLFRLSVIGNFAASSSADAPDIVALASLQENRRIDKPGTGPNPTTPPAPSDADAKVRAWSVRGTSAGLDGTQSDGVAIDGIDDCAVPEGGGLCMEEAVTLTWPNGERDVVIAVDRRGTAVMFDPRNVMSNKLSATMLDLGRPTGTIRSLRRADFDGDGAFELIASFAPGPSGGTGAILVCPVTNGVPANCVDLLGDITRAVPSTTACLDAAPGRFAFRGPTSEPGVGDELVVLCRDSGAALHRVYRENGAIGVATLSRPPGKLSSLRVGDVNGDGVDDVVALEGELGARNLVVLTQCSSRNAATCVRLDTSREQP